MADDFQTGAELSISVNQSSLRDARRTIESELGDIEVDVIASLEGGGGAVGSRSPESAGIDLSRRQLGELERANEFLEVMTEDLDDLAIGGGGGGGGDGGGGIGPLGLGIAAGGATLLGGIGASAATFGQRMGRMDLGDPLSLIFGSEAERIRKGDRVPEDKKIDLQVPEDFPPELRLPEDFPPQLQVPEGIPPELGLGEDLLGDFPPKLDLSEDLLGDFPPKLGLDTDLGEWPPELDTDIDWPPKLDTDLNWPPKLNLPNLPPQWQAVVDFISNNQNRQNQQNQTGPASSAEARRRFHQIEQEVKNEFQNQTNVDVTIDAASMARDVSNEVENTVQTQIDNFRRELNRQLGTNL